jgi:hypothetical protein
MKKSFTYAHSLWYGLNLKNFSKLTILALFPILLGSCDKEQVQTEETVKDEAGIDENLIYYFPFSGNSIDQVSKIEYDTHGAEFADDRKNNANSALCLKDNWMDLAAGLGDEEGTLSFWIKMDTIDYVSPIFTKATYSSVQGEYFIGIYNGRVYTVCQRKWGYKENLTLTEPIIKKNKWYHLVFRWDDVKRKIEIFVNDKKVLSENYVGDASEWGVTNEHPLMGKNIELGNHSPEEYFFDGRIDEIRRYSKWLSDSEIAYLYTE